MARHTSVLLGLVNYSPDLSYEALHSLESEYIEGLTELLEKFGAEHLDFWGIGDGLQLEAAFAEANEESMRGLCDEFCSLLRAGCRARLAFLDKNLTWMELFHLESGHWRQERLDIADTFYRRSFQGHRP